MKGRKLIWVGIYCILFFIGSIQVRAEGGEKKRIYFVYDNSRSMVRNLETNEEHDWGAQAQYAVKAFCAMSNPEDEIKFYRVDNDEDGQGNSWPKSIGKVDNQDTNRENYGELVDSIIFHGQQTYYEQIREAIVDIRETSDDAEKWVVMFTDGPIEKNPKVKYTEAEFYEMLRKDLNGTNINFYFVNISPEEETNKFEEDRTVKTIENIKWYRLADERNVNILQSILTVTEEIYGKRRLPEENISIEENGTKKLEIRFDIPIKDVVVLLQTDEGKGGGEKLSFEKAIKDCDWNYSITSESKEDIKSEVGDSEEKMADDGVVQGAYGEIIGFESVTKKNKDGEYYIELEILQEDIQYAVYYTPAVIPQVSVVPCNESENILKDGKYVEGEHNIFLNLIDQNTKEIVNNSELLKGEKVEIKVNNESHEIELKGKGEEKIITEVFEQGNVGIEVKAEWGIKGEDVQFIVENNLEAYEIQLRAEEDTFYYNRLKNKENAVLVTLMDGEENVTERFSDAQLKVEFWSNGKLCKKIDYEQEQAGQVWRIYPYLKDDKDREISGDLICKVSVILNSEYYQKPIVKSQEIKLNMGIDEFVFDVEIIKEDIDIKYWKLIIPFFKHRIPIQYIWNGEELNEKEIKEIKTKVQLVYATVTEERNLENKAAYIRRGWKNFFDYPEEIVIYTQASFEAFGESGTNDAKETIILENVSVKEVIKMILALMGIIIFVFVTMWNIVQYILWCVKEGCGWKLRIKADSRYEASGVWVPQITKTKYKWMIPFFKGILAGYYFEVCIKIPVRMKETELLLEIFSDVDTYQIQIKNGYFPEGTLWANGKKISNEPIELSKSTVELNLELKEGQSQRIKIRFGGEK